MAKVVTVNRVGAVIKFEDIIGGVKMTFPKSISRFLTFSKDKDLNLTMIEPEGGPVVELEEDLEYYFKDSKKRIVHSIEKREDYYLLKVRS